MSHPNIKDRILAIMEHETAGDKNSKPVSMAWLCRVLKEPVAPIRKALQMLKNEGKIIKETGGYRIRPPIPKRGKQRAFPVCHCRYCPDGRIRVEVPYCELTGEGIDLSTPDGAFPESCPLPDMPEGGP